MVQAVSAQRTVVHSSIAEGGDFVIPVFRQGYTEFQGGQAVDPVPNYVPPTDEAGPYPLCMVTPKAHAFMNSRYGYSHTFVDVEPA